MAKVSELEGVVLGIIHRLQPCTTYAVRRELKASPSTHWSASAGSIYPLLERFEAGGWVKATTDSGDGRGRRLLQLTVPGRRTLRKWTLAAREPETAAAVFDGVRARAFSVGALTPRERERFATDTLAALEGHLAVTRAHLASDEDAQDEYERLAALGGVYAAEARVEWMKQFIAELADACET